MRRVLLVAVVVLSMLAGCTHNHGRQSYGTQRQGYGYGYPYAGYQAPYRGY